MKKALFFEKLKNNKVRCLLCPHNCLIADEQMGICRVRKNFNGELFESTFGMISAMHSDPIEKKPLYHYFPGASIFSIGSIGCNLKCKFCQNYQISQFVDDDFQTLKKITSTEIISISKNVKNNIGIAYTYNEPTVWFEFMLETAEKAKGNNLKNIMITNGFINKKPLQELLNFMDAFNVDLKSFSENFYKNITSSSLNPIKETLKTIRNSGKHLEITNLIIPTLNDDKNFFEEMIQWIKNELGENTVLHLSKYFPNYKMKISETPDSTMNNLFHRAKNHLKYVYLGNMFSTEGKDTYCANCGKTVIRRNGYHTEITALIEGSCKYCGNKILNHYL